MVWDPFATYGDATAELAGGNGHWTVTPTAAGAQRIQVTVHDNTGVYEDAVAYVTVNVSRAPLTVRSFAADAQGNEVDRATYGSLDGISWQLAYDGFVNGDTAEDFTNGHGTLEATPLDPGLNAGTYDIAILRYGASVTLNGQTYRDVFVSRNYLITYETGSFTVDPAPLLVATPSAEKEYDGEPLAAADGAALEGLVAGETATVSATGSQTDVGSSANGYAIEWGTAKESNYQVASENLGTLTVTANSSPVKVTAASASKAYDGAPLEAAGAEVAGLPDGITYQAEAEGSQTDAGSSASEVSSYAFRDSSGKDVTSYFSNVSTADGALTVDPAPLSVSTESASKAYDGEPLTAGGSLEGLVAGETATFSATGSQTEVGSSANTYEIAWDGTAKESNYEVASESLGTLTVTAAAPAPTPDSDGSDGNDPSDGQEPTGTGDSGDVDGSVGSSQPTGGSSSSTPATGDAPLGAAAAVVAAGALGAAGAAFRRTRRSKR